ncbi:MAG: hypothetical protein HKN20_15740 [Gemmatimonadetes bacterium]|nr:hypothetical protein [Gemmatimonadota bacterium]
MKPAAADRLTFAFHRLQERLSADGRFVPIEDLTGISGAPFRMYWKAWDAHSAAVCSGEPLRRAARAYGFELASGDTYGENEGFRAIEDQGPMTLRDRIDLFKKSIEEGQRLAHEEEYGGEGEGESDGGGHDDDEGGTDGESPLQYASGFAAYRALASDIAPLRRTTAGDETWLSLRAVFESISISRRMCALYLNHLANFIGVAPAIAPFRRESQALGEASRIVASIVSGHGEDERSLVIPVLEAEDAYREAIEALASAREPA